MNIYIGFDSSEPIAYDVCRYSIHKHTTCNVNVQPLKLDNLRSRGLYYRDHDTLGSTEFTFSRFLVPVLNEYNDWAIFCDQDFLWLDDVNELLSHTHDKYAVMVVKHDYTPRASCKMNNKAQHIYPRKNWSSLVLWNCNHPSNKQIDITTVNSQTGMFLHRFMWLQDNEIGEINYEWNWLTDWYTPQHGSPKALHFTTGGPWLNNYKNCNYADEWNRYYEEYSQESDH